MVLLVYCMWWCLFLERTQDLGEIATFSKWSLAPEVSNVWSQISNLEVIQTEQHEYFGGSDLSITALCFYLGKRKPGMWCCGQSNWNLRGTKTVSKETWIFNCSFGRGQYIQERNRKKCFSGCWQEVDPRCLHYLYDLGKISWGIIDI